jgi:tetratricopeptide (TPR) repeat protein
MDLRPHAALGARVLLAQVLRGKGDPAAALAELESALAAASDAPGLLFPRRQALAHRVGTLLELGRAEEALAAAKEAVTAESEDVRSQVLALRALGSSWRACGDEEQARTAFLHALDVARGSGLTAEAEATEALLRR